MAIRIRKVGGHVVALCAAKTEAKEGDIYLDDNAHHALSTKFACDWFDEGIEEHAETWDEDLVIWMNKEEGGGHF